MTSAYVNRIATAVPPHDVHRKFVEYAPRLLADERTRKLFRRMADRAQIESRWSVLRPHPDPDRLDLDETFRPGAFPDTQTRMELYERHALDLAAQAIDDLELGDAARDVTHVILTSCTGFYAPGVDLQLIARIGLRPEVERTIVGFMGCYAAINALKLARHVVRSEPDAKVLMVNLELCTIHMQETGDLEQILSFLIFADGCAAALVSAEPTGLRLDRFHAAVLPESAELITWRIGRGGFDMFLSGAVPGAIQRGMPAALPALLGNRGANEVTLWAVHPGGRTVLDAVESALDLSPDALGDSRAVLRDYGNMSSATIMFVLKRMLDGAPADRLGCAFAFGPGLTAEGFTFQTAA